MRVCGLALLITCLVGLGCGPAPGYRPREGGRTSRTASEGGRGGGSRPSDGPDWVARIDDEATFHRLAARPEYVSQARTEAVKVILDREGEVPLYFLDSNRWDLHFFFVRHYLDRHADHARFNVTQYRRPDRRFVLATLVHYLDGDHYTFELVAGDTLDGEGIRAAFEQVREALWIRDRLRFRPASPSQEAIAARLGHDLPSLSPDAVLADVRYQPVVVGEAYGYLRLVRGTLDPSALRPNDVVVTDDVPEELPPVSALVTSRLQAPLAHVAVLSRNRGTPDMALRGAIDAPAIATLEGQLVRVRVSPQDFVIERADLRLAEDSWDARRPRAPYTPASSVRVRSLRPVCSLHISDAEFAGAKAAQLGAVCRLGGDIVTPGGFVVPFFHYVDHLRRADVLERLPPMLRDPTFVADARAREARLAELRRRLQAAEVPASLLADVRRRLAENPTRKHIFRSSTNAEDLPGFNGAGLYESVVVPASPTDAVIADALRRVWASVFLVRAHEERSWYRIRHEAVAMAVLVQPFVDDVVGNGVAVTVNPFDEARPGVFINVQSQGGSVTGARGDEVPEQYLVYTWAEAPEPELLSRSSRTNGRPILGADDLLKLVGILRRIHDHMLPHYRGQANGMDVEFLLGRDTRAFVIVQARPFRVVYEPGQTFRYP